jgi:hypothetical protein
MIFSGVSCDRVIAPRCARGGSSWARGDGKREFQDQGGWQGGGASVEVVAGGRREPKAWWLTGRSGCRGRGLGVRARLGAAVVASKEVMPVAKDQGSVPRADVLEAALVVPWGPPRCPDEG